ncbi:MAG: citrate (Si)-synthase [Saprospiraceae bacterium]|nr:citrate (Si)-synthase [Saprospiraceae bacterium]
MKGEIQIHRGLNNVYFDRSEACFIDGRIGKLLYRGYSIHDLAKYSTFEETSYLLLFGDLPTKEALVTFINDLKMARTLPPPVIKIIRGIHHAHPMEVLRTAVSALAAFDPDVADNTREATQRKSIRLIAQVPSIIAAHHRIRNDLDPVAPDTSLNHAANFLLMLHGESPSADAASLVDTDFILHAEHGSNASSFTARVVAGTQANLHAALTAAIGALSGSSHGGAAENVMRMAQEIGEPERAEEYVKMLRSQRKAIMGFGHRVYRTEDPRARHIRAGVKRLSEQMGQPHWYNVLEAVSEAMKPYARHGINVNVDFYAGVIYYLLGIPEDVFVPIFAIGRIPGWAAQVLEQYENNILIRPRTQYSGKKDLTYVPIDQR